MTVCANEVAFRQLVENKRLVVPAIDQSADLGNLLGPGKMIPLHGRPMECETAIGTRFTGFERLSPRRILGLPALLLGNPSVPGPPVVIAVVRLATTLAPSLVPRSDAPMKFADAFPTAAAATSLHDGKIVVS